MIKNIIFDVGDVLIGYRWFDLLAGYGLSKEEATEVVTIVFVDPMWRLFDAGQVTLDEVMDNYKEKNPDKYDIIHRLINSQNLMCVKRPAVWELLPKLKEKGYKLYVLSNYSKLLYEMHTSDCDFHQYMDGEVISYMTGHTKPDKEIYNYIIDKYQLDPAECLFFDDRAANVDAAIALGWQARQVFSEEGLIEMLGELL